MSVDKWLAQALLCYDLDGPCALMIRHNENAAWQVTDAKGKTYVLRVHQPREGFSQALFQVDKAAALRGELAILQALHKQGELTVQSPVVNRENDVLSLLPGGEYATLLTWLNGDTLEQTQITPALLLETGRMTASLHKCLKACGGLPDNAGRAYDKGLTDRMAARLFDLEVAGAIPQVHEKAMTAALSVIRQRMAELDKLPNSYGIAHSDLSKSNMLLCGGKLAPIDFGLWGYGYYYMDLGALASHFASEEEQEAIFAGYESVAGIRVERRFVAPFISLGILLFICAFAEHVCGEEWFPQALERWRQTFFQPLAEGG